MQSFFTGKNRYIYSAAVLVGLSLVLPAQSSGQQVPDIGQYDLFEIELSAPTIVGNKYKDVNVHAVFSGPTKTIDIDGFWDGADKWKVRMAPTEPGIWQYAVSSSTHPQLAASGSFNCVASGKKGFIRRATRYPYSFIYDDGTPWLWKGDTSWRGMTYIVGFEERWKPYIDLRASQGYTAVQCILVSFINGDEFWRNEGGYVFELTSSGKNYDRLNPGYFQWVDERIEYALSRGITPVLFFTWSQEFIKFSQPQFERYIQYLVARYGAYNVIWCISGEYNEAYDHGFTANTWKHYGSYLRSLDPYDHPVTLHPSGNSSSVEFAGESWFDVIMQQTFQTTDPNHAEFNINWHSDLLADRTFSKPVVNGEYGYAGYIANNYIRSGAWDIITAGGFITAGFKTTYAPDKGGWDLTAWQQQQNELAGLFGFLETTKWRELSPADNLVSNGRCLAKPGEEYIIYAPNGGSSTVNLSAVTGEISTQWFNPVTQAYSQKANVTGGASVVFTPPFAGDWVLHIGDGTASDALPPNPPANLALVDRTMNSLTLSWAPPGMAADGDIASGYRIYRDGQSITDTYSTSFTDSNLQPETSYQYAIYAKDDKGNISLSATSGSFNTLEDTEPPQIVQTTLNSATQLVLQFSEPVNKSSAENIANYQISPTIHIYFSYLDSDKKTLRLTTDSHSLNIAYTITVNNVYDLSTAQNNIAANTAIGYRLKDLQITNMNKSNYVIDYLDVNKNVYIDRVYTFTSVPASLQNRQFIRTANDDKTATNNPFLTFTIDRDAKIYVAFYRNTSLPAWLTQNWSNSGITIQTTDKLLYLFEKNVQAGQIALGPNAGNSSSSMYIVIFSTSGEIDSQRPAPPTGLLLQGM